MASSGNFATINFEAQSLISTVTPTLGNLKFDGSTLSPGNYNAGVVCNFGMTGGKWYWEIYLSGGGSPQGGRDWSVGFAPYSTCSKTTDEGTYGQDLGNGSSATLSGYSFSHVNASSTGIRHNNSTDTSGGYSDHSSGDVLGFALDLDNGTWIIYRNGSSLGTVATGIDTSLTYFAAVGASGGTISNFDVTCNFGQDSTFGGAITAGGNADGNGFGDFKYSVPSGYLACSTANLSISSDIDPAQTDDDYAGGKQHNTIVYTGNASTNAITGLGFKPDLVWIQNYSSQNQTARMQDSSRGVTKSLEPAYTTNEATESGVTAFGTDGFTLGSQQGGYNSSGASYVAWCWRANGGTTASNSEGSGTSTVQANTAAGFSIVQFPNYSGDTTFGHGLTKTPNFIIAKLISGGSNWPTYHDAWSSGKACFLNKDDAEATSSHFAHSGTGNPVSATTFGMGASFAGSGAGIAFVWHSVEGFSKFGSYVGNGATDGPFIHTGFRPKLIFVKLVASAGNWWVQDVGRSTYNPLNKYIAWDSDGGEQSGLDVDFLGNGFKVRSSSGDLNSNDAIIAYGAWGDVPFKYNNTF